MKPEDLASEIDESANSAPPQPPLSRLGARGSETLAWHAMAEEHHQHGLRQLLARILGPKVDNNSASIIAEFLVYRCMLCDERPGVITRVEALWEWRCITCVLGLQADDTWEHPSSDYMHIMRHRSIHIHPGSSPARCLSTGSEGLREDSTLKNALRDPFVPRVFVVKCFVE